MYCEHIRENIKLLRSSDPQHRNRVPPYTIIQSVLTRVGYEEVSDDDCKFLLDICDIVSIRAARLTAAACAAVTIHMGGNAVKWYGIVQYGLVWDARVWYDMLLGISLSI